MSLSVAYSKLSIVGETSVVVLSLKNILRMNSIYNIENNIFEGKGLQQIVSSMVFCPFNLRLIDVDKKRE